MLRVLLGLERDEIQSIFEQVSEGVCYMHDQGIAHRDIKADNVFIANNTRPLVRLVLRSTNSTQPQA